MEKINISELLKHGRLNDDTRDSWVRWGLIHAIAEKSNETGKTASDFPGITPRKTGDPDIIVEVDFKINGVECNFSDLMARLISNFDSSVKKSANNYVDNGVREAVRKLSNSADEFVNRLELIILDAKDKILPFPGEGKIMDER